MKTIAVVHAKGTSERLPNKNLKELGGLPLIAHAIINARDSIADKVVIDSEDAEILEVGTAFGAEPLERSPYLSRNEITGDDLAYWQAQNFPDYDIIVQVVPTSPFTKPETINKCIGDIRLGNNSCFTMSGERLYTWEQNEANILYPGYYENKRLLNSFELPVTYIEHTGVYAFKTSFALEHKKRIDIYNFGAVLIDSTEKIDINYEEDFEFAEIVWRGLQHSKTNIEIHVAL